MSFSSHIRTTFLSGVFAAIPIAATVAVIYYINLYTEPLAPRIYGHRIPFFGLIIAAVAVYFLGLFVSTALAKYTLHRLDRLLERVPALQHIYRAWKQISLNRGSASMWDKVALVRLDGALTIGFTSGVPLDDAPHILCVYIPSAPAPTTGRLLFLRATDVQILLTPPEEAFKHLLSGGNYLPPSLSPAANQLLPPSQTSP